MTTQLIGHRAFIAASRRKDRSLDARVESAQRASSLHKKRTGRALYITREIVEKEAMYEEIDERYLEKRTQMLRAQNLQIEAQFREHLLATLQKDKEQAARMTPPTPVSPPAPMGNETKMSMDFSNMSSTLPEGMTSPFLPGDGYALSPTGTFDQPSYMNNMSHDTFPNMVPAQIAAYVSQQPQTWQTQATSQQFFWTGLQQPLPTNMQSAMWQQPAAPQYPAAEADYQAQPFRNRLQSAPELPVYGIPPVAGPATHTRVNSEPNLSAHQALNIVHSGSSSPSSLNGDSASELCLTPSTPPQETNIFETCWANAEAEDLTLPDAGPGPTFNDSRQFTLEMGNDIPMKDLEQLFGLDDFLTIDDFTTIA